MKEGTALLKSILFYFNKLLRNEMSESEGTYSVWTASALIFNAVVGMGIWTVPKESFIANQSRDLALSYII